MRQVPLLLDRNSDRGDEHGEGATRAIDPDGEAALEALPIIVVTLTHGIATSVRTAASLGTGWACIGENHLVRGH